MLVSNLAYNLQLRIIVWWHVVCNFQAADVDIQMTRSPKPKPDPDNLVFGKEFSDHMLVIDWTQEGGWKHPVIKPLQDFHIHPAAKVFHYAVEVSHWRYILT